jgi:hypothetical protein
MSEAVNLVGDTQETVDLHTVKGPVHSRLHTEARKAFARLHPWVPDRPTVLLYVATKSDDDRVYCALGNPHSHTSMANIVVELPTPYTRSELERAYSTGTVPGTMIRDGGDQTQYIVKND